MAQYDGYEDVNGIRTVGDRGYDKQPAVSTENFHAITGPNGMCECGVRADGTVVTCGALLETYVQQRLSAVPVVDEKTLRTIIGHPFFALAREWKWDDAQLAAARKLIDVTVILVEEFIEQATNKATLPAMPVWKCKSCGCLWRDNLDDTVSLLNAEQKSCAACEESTPHCCEIHWILPASSSLEGGSLAAREGVDHCAEHMGEALVLVCPLCFESDKTAAATLRGQHRNAVNFAEELEHERDAAEATIATLRKVLELPIAYAAEHSEFKDELGRFWRKWLEDAALAAPAAGTLEVAGPGIIDYTDALPHDFQPHANGGVSCTRCHVGRDAHEAEWNGGKCERTARIVPEAAAGTEQTAPAEPPDPIVRARWLTSHVDQGHSLTRRDDYDECSCGATFSRAADGRSSAPAPQPRSGDTR